MPMGVYDRQWRGCNVTGCPRKHKAKGLCRIHYRRLLRHGDVNANFSEKGRPFILKHGRPYVFRPNSPMACSRGTLARLSRYRTK